MQNLIIFENQNIEIIKYNGQILFNANNVAKILDIKNIREMLRDMNENQVIKLTNSDVSTTDIRKLNNNGENFLTESGVYKLAFKSRKPKAEKFTDWVTDQVLPQIRQYGTYKLQQHIPAQQSLQTQDLMTQALLQILSTQNQILDRLTIPQGQLQSTNNNIENQENQQQTKKTVPKTSKKRNNKCLIETLPHTIRKLVDTMIISDDYTYNDIQNSLKTMGYKLSHNAIYNYKKKFWM